MVSIYSKGSIILLIWLFSLSCRSSLQEEHDVLSLLWQAEAVGSLLSQVGPKTVLCHLRLIARVTQPQILQRTHSSCSNTYCILLQYWPQATPSTDWHVQTKVPQRTEINLGRLRGCYDFFFYFLGFLKMYRLHIGLHFKNHEIKKQWW